MGIPSQFATGFPDGMGKTGTDAVSVSILGVLVGFLVGVAVDALVGVLVGFIVEVRVGNFVTVGTGVSVGFAINVPQAENRRNNIRILIDGIILIILNGLVYVHITKKLRSACHIFSCLPRFLLMIWVLEEITPS